MGVMYSYCTDTAGLNWRRKLTFRVWNGYVFNWPTAVDECKKRLKVNTEPLFYKKNSALIK